MAAADQDPPVKHKTKKRRRSKLSLDASIVIVGGGLAGWSVALALQQAGYQRIALYERDNGTNNNNKTNYGMTLSYGNGGLAQLGVLEAVARKDCPSRSHYVFGVDGRVLGYFGNIILQTSSSLANGQRGNLRIPRQELQKLLSLIHI